MGNHRSVRAGSSRSGWRRAAIVGVGVGFAYATVGVVGLASGTTSSAPSLYSAITPVTVLGRSLAADSNTDVVVAGVGSVPSNATSVQLSVTALSGTTTSSMYVYPSGSTKPTSANVRWQTGQTVTIPVTVAVGNSHEVRLTTDGGTVTVKVAVVGYFTAATVGTSYADQEDSSVAVGHSTPVTLVSVSVPAGTYQVEATAVLDLTNDEATCTLKDPVSGFSQSVVTSDSTSLLAVNVVVIGLDTNSGGTLSMTCFDNDNTSSATDANMIATLLSSASGAVGGD